MDNAKFSFENGYFFEKIEKKKLFSTKWVNINEEFDEDYKF